MVPLYALREAIQYSGVFDDLGTQIGNYPNRLQAEDVEILGGQATIRNVTGVCDQQDVLDQWAKINIKILDENDLDGLIFRTRFFPKNVACLDFEGGVAVMDNGMDANQSPHPFWSQVVIDLFVDHWKGLHVFGPFTEKSGEDIFCTHIPMYTDTTGENAFKDVMDVQGTEEQNVYGFAMYYLNWSEMKKRSNMYERFADVDMEFELFREEEPRLGDIGPKGESTKEMSKLAWSEYADKLNEGNSVEVRTESLHGIWVNR
jgi:hypothetical protein